MAIREWARFSLATLVMLIVTAAAGSALFAEIHEHSPNPPSSSSTWSYDVSALATAAIATTAMALGALKGHSATQVMLQALLVYLGCLSLIWLGEANQKHILMYWYQTIFFLTVALPLGARRLVKRSLPRGPRRSWWKGTCEAVVFSFLNLHLVAAGVVIQFLAAEIGGQLL